MDNIQIIENVKAKHLDIYKELKISFKSDDIMLSWLSKPKVVLQGLSPLEQLEIDPGLVLDMLIRMKTGDFS